MALVLVEGFDHYAGAQAAEKFWNGTIIMGPGRGFGGQSAGVVFLNPVFKTLPSTYSTLIANAAFKLTGVASPRIMTLEASGAVAVDIGLDSSGHLTLRDSVGNLIATGATIVPYNTWFYVSVKVTIGGNAVVQLNGAAEIASVSGNWGVSNLDRIVFWNMNLGGDATNVDDVVVMDSSGSAPLNDFLGDVRVETLYPVADGTHTDWTPKVGTDHYAMVNEHLIDGDGSFVYDATPGDKDSYIIETFIGSIYGAQLNIGARKGDASVRQIKPLVRQGGTDYLGPLWTLSADYVINSWQLDNDPTGTPWTAAQINADEFGQDLIA